MKFSELSEKDPSNILIVDSLNLGFRWKHSGAKVFSDAYIDTVKSLARSYKCGTVIITADSGSSSYRKRLFPDYKQNRVDLRANQTEKEKQDFEDFFTEYEHTLRQLEAEGFLILQFSRVEADDIAAYLCKYRENFGFKKIWLVSSDRDWDLLIADDVSRFSYVTRKETTKDNWLEEYDFELENYVTFKCLTGDKGDNVPGINGVGPKRAVQLMEKYGDIFDIYNACPLNGAYKYIDAVNSNKEQLLINTELMDLVTYCDEAIGYENALELRDKVKEYMDARQ